MTITDEMPFSFEEVPCDFCQSAESTFVMQGEDWKLGIAGSFTLVRCSTCGLVFMNPRPIESDLPKAYPESYVPHAATRLPNRQKLEVAESNLKIQLKAHASAHSYGLSVTDGNILGRIISPGARLYGDSLGITWFPPISQQRPKALDFGCGSGTVLRQLSEAGWDAIGIEPSSEAASRAREMTGCEVIVGTIPGIQLDELSLNFVVLQHVLEHLPSPLATLREISKLIKPGGYMRITVPNFSSPEVRALGESWYGMELPRHLYHFGKEQLTNYIESCGLIITRLQFTSEGWQLLGSIKHKWGNPTGESRKLTQIATTVLGRTLSITGYGGIMTAYCRKPETGR